MQYEPTQILDQFNYLIKSALKNSFLDWRNEHQEKIKQLQNTVDVLKIHLVHSEDWKNLPEEFWLEIETKISKIHSWTESLIYTPDDITLEKISKNWQTQFDNLISDFPQEIWILIGETYWQSQSGDGIFVRIRKSYQPIKRKFNGLKSFVINIIRRITKKPLLEKKKPARKINLYNFLYNYVKTPLLKFTSLEWQKYLQAVSGQLFVLHNNTNELAKKSLLLDEFDSFFDFSAQKDIFSKLYDLAEILKSMDKTLQALAQHEKQFVDRLDKTWEDLSKNFLQMWNIAGTFQLPTRKYSDQRFIYSLKRFENRFDKCYKSWQIHFKGLKDGWRKDLQLNILQLRVARIARSITIGLREKVENNIKPAFFEIFSILNKEVKDFESVSSIKDFKQSIITEKNSFLKKLQKVQLPQLIDTIYQTQFGRALNNLVVEVLIIYENFSNEYNLFQSRDTTNLPPKSKVSAVSLKDLINKEIIFDLQESHKQSVKTTEAVLEKIFRTISEIERVVDFNMNEALNVLKDDKDGNNLDSAKEIIISGLKRGIALIDESVKECSTIPENLRKEILKNTLDFENRIDLLKDNDKIFEVRLKLDREEIRNNRRQSRSNFFRYLKSFIPIIFSSVANIFKRASASEKSKVKKKESFLYLNMKVAEKEIRLYHSNVKEQLSKIPYVYQRLFQFESINDDRFFTSRENELNTIRDDFQKWQNGEDIVTALIGERGSGKTTLLNFAEKQIFPPYPVSRMQLNTRVLNETDIVGIMSKSLNLKNITKFSDIQKRLLEEDIPKILIVGNIQYLFLKVVQGFETLENFIQLVLNTKHKVFWIITCSLISWHYLEKAIQISKNFQRIISLESLLKEQIKSIILERHSISGYNIEFDVDMKIKKSSEYKKQQNAQMRQEFIMDQFFERLNSVSQGNISLSMFYWLRAIKQILKDRIILDPIISFDNAIFNNLQNEDLFTLGCIIQHDKLSINDHTRILRQNTAESQSILSRLFNYGLLDTDEQDYKIHTYVYRNISQILKQKNILP